MNGENCKMYHSWNTRGQTSECGEWGAFSLESVTDIYTNRGRGNKRMWMKLRREVHKHTHIHTHERERERERE